MAQIFIFGLGYTAQRIAAELRARGWRVDATGSAGNFDFDDFDRVRMALDHSTHILSSVPPEDVTGGDDVLMTYGSTIAARRGQWLGYLSSTGVYGDTGGAWVDESAPIGTGRRSARAEADARWLALGAHVFRLPGIYGPGRSALERVATGRAHRIDLPQQVFSRVHVDDIVSGVLASFDAAPGAWNLADDLPTSQNAVIEEACRLLGRDPPPLLSLDEAGLGPMARGFYAENRRVANGRAKRLLGWLPKYPTYQEGLRALNATTSPAIASAAPAPANKVQR
jgi:nucleoside-diphosphate-sugar epimerase